MACGDVYSVSPNVGRGGWTWYTGSAAWMYRVVIEYMLGIRVSGKTLVIDPVIPSSWPQFEVTFRHGSTTYSIVVENPQRRCKGVSSMTVDGITVASNPATITISDDGKTHNVHILMGGPAKDV